MNKLLSLAMVALTIGCTTHKSSINNITVNPGEFTAPVQQQGCGWVTVDEEFATGILMLKFGATSRQYNKSLYYCCPGANNPEPICYQSQWVSK